LPASFAIRDTTLLARLTRLVDTEKRAVRLQFSIGREQNPEPNQLVHEFSRYFDIEVLR
jgi:hypothetical protein